MRPAEDRLFERYRRSHDGRLLAKVFDRTAPALLRIARHTAPRRDLADDLLQQTFLAAIEGAERWNPERGLFPWLVGILVRQASLLRRREVRELSPERLGSSIQPLPPADAAEARELENAIADAIAELGHTYRPVLHLHLFHGLNAKEIAASLDRPAGSVRTQLVRGLERLREALPVGLAVGALAMAPVLASVRHAVLQHASSTAATLAAPGATTTLLLLEGSMMKKWSLAAVAVLLVTLLAYPFLTATAAGEASNAAPGPRSAAAGPTLEPDAELRAASPAAAPPSQSIATGQREPLATPGASVQVRVVAGSAADAPALEGVWVHLQSEAMPRPGEPSFGARTDADGSVQFDEVPAQAWRVTALTGAEDARQSIDLEPGAVREVVLRSRSTRFVPVQVVDASGRPVAEAEVWSGIQIGGRLPPLRTSTRRTGRTDSSGRANVAVGRSEVVSARKPGHAASQASPADPTSPETIVLVLRDGPGKLHGELVFDDGEPAAMAMVRVYPETPPEATRLAPHRSTDGRRASAPLAVLHRADAFGHFEVEGLAPGSYRVWTDASTPMYAGVAASITAGDRHHVRLILPRRAYVTGRVLRYDGSPAAGLFIGVRRPTDERISSSNVVDPNGGFTFAVPPGPLRIEAWRGPGTPLLEVDAVASVNPEPLTLTIDDPLSVAGRLLHEDGSPLPHWILGVLARGVPVTEATVSTAMVRGNMGRSQADGSFALHGGGEGPYTVFAAPVRRSVTGPAPIQRLAVPVGTTDLEIRVPASLLEAATLSLRIVDRDGAPIRDAHARLRAGGDSFELQPTSDGLTHDHLVHGSYLLEAQAPGHAGLARRITIDSSALDLGDLTLDPAVPLRVTPRLGDRPWTGPLPRPIVHHAETGTPVEPQPTVGTIDDGTLVLDGLPPGRFELRTDPDDDLLGPVLPVHLAPGQAPRVDWQLRIGRDLALRFPADPAALATERLRVTIRDPSGKVVVARDLTPEPDRTHFALQYEFTPGRYIVEALRRTGHEWRWNLDTARWRNGGVVEVPRLR